MPITKNVQKAFYGLGTYKETFHIDFSLGKKKPNLDFLDAREY